MLPFIEGGRCEYQYIFTYIKQNNGKLKYIFDNVNKGENKGG